MEKLDGKNKKEINHFWKESNLVFIAIKTVHEFYLNYDDIRMFSHKILYNRHFGMLWKSYVWDT